MYVYSCGVSPNVSDVTQRFLTFGDMKVPLPSEVKCLGTEADRVLALEEMAMRTLHEAYSRNRKGESHNNLFAVEFTKHRYTNLLLSRRL